ncbi:PAS domain-containing sensor histidine kinase [Aquimarina agarivorans]|uniref:PAS domain-containing sensor histidine kinase n=1 Tax=Aquimarina agarivorans TaxID=980584 RepID=UPI000248EC5F|nr:ATP-binding protein [Aquimarina agarivorans]
MSNTSITDMSTDNSQLFINIFSNTIDGILITDAISGNSDEIIIKYGNKVFCDMFHISEKDIKGKSFKSLPQSERIFYILNELTLSNTKIETQRIPLINYGIEGEFYDFELDIIPIFELQQLSKWALTFRDVSDRVAPMVSKLKQTESFNKIILENSPDCLKILDNEGKLKFMNYNGLCQMEIDNFEEFEDKYWWDLWGKGNENIVKKAVDKAIHGDVAQFTAYCPTAKGTPKWWNVNVIPVVNDEKQGVYQLLSVSRDITEQRRIEEEIKDHNKNLESKVVERTQELILKNVELERINSEMELFNRVASHDLQEPLRKIQMFTSRIIDSDDKLGDAKGQFDKIMATTKRMRSMIQSLHEFTATKDTDESKEDCQLPIIINKAIEDLEDEIKISNAQIYFEDLPMIRGYKTLLYQLFRNLIQNSIKYAKKNVHPVIKFSYSVIDEDEILFENASKAKEFHEILVNDNGIGFDNSYSEKIFEPFERLHGKHEYSGTGIGLSICKSIMLNHKGWIMVDSEPGIGSTFKLYFPKYS